MNTLKDLILSGFMALSKVEQNILKEVIMGGDDSVKQEQQMRKSEIKLISRKRFYEILERADEIISNKDKERLTLLMEQRGLSEDTLTFKNQVYSDMFENKEYKFKTDNGLFRFANVVHIKDASNLKEITFFINTIDNPSVINHYNQLTGLKYFEVDENLRKYGYTIYDFIGIEKPNQYEIALKFTGQVKIDGVKQTINEDEEIRVMGKKDLINPNPNNTYTLGSGDFLLG